MKKTLTSLYLLLIITLFAGCGSQQESINVYNYGKYIDPGVLEIFEEETGIKVNYENYETNEEMYQKVKAGASQYDVIFPSDYMVERMASEGLLLELDKDQLSNFENIMDDFLALPYDSTNTYSVPYFWGTLGILYNTTMVDETVDNWDILWNPEYDKNILMQSSMRDAFAVALKSLGYSLNTKDMTELEAAKQKLIDQSPLVYAYVVDQAQDMMIGNEAALAVIYSGEAYYAMDANPDLAYAIPEEGSNIWVDNMCIPSTTDNKEGAQLFINFMLRPDVAYSNANYVGYPTTNQVTYDDMIPEKMKNHPALYSTDAAHVDVEFLKDLGDFNPIYDEMWTEILTN
ncbi:ABC transporter substrate-binding protein [Vallitalea okinawensis]|uniref:ABC transporter substrate-binding protein n=1 Tax=Vallitalea okinawensis TaxID=2078660 RepID=UPI000CFD31B9|nr:ABC transporter substrate-binding protein [Vallitalea okinawensis]